MGLAEKRRIKEFKEAGLSAIVQRFRDETGLSLPIEVDLDSFAAIADLDVQNQALDWIAGLVNSGEFWSEPFAAAQSIGIMSQKKIRQ